jgi:thymidylate kinase
MGVCVSTSPDVVQALLVHHSPVLICLVCATSFRSAIERDLEAGMTVIADRYAFSGIAFSAAKVSPPPYSPLHFTTPDC